ncbi:MAG: SDR family oxidoreductase [Elusimicrobia bacterium]|nr:SDR family oxidoreductase [Elusimicrobiota bacterium]
MSRTYAKDLLAGRVAVVTGGGSGIGRVVAAELAAHGADVVLAARDGARLDEAARAIAAQTGRRAVGVSTDVADPKSVEALFTRVDAEFGRVDILVNGAAANFVRPSETLTSVRFRKVIDIVLQGTFSTSIAAGRRMLARGEGAIVNLVASYAWTGAPGFLPSSAAKAGVVALTRTLGVEWAPRGVRVNAVCPGLIDTPQSRERLWPEEWMREELLNGVPARKFGSEADVSDAVLYLCAPATRYVSGEVLVVDGGSSVGGVPYLRFVEKAGAVRRARPDKS